MNKARLQNAKYIGINVWCVSSSVKQVKTEKPQAKAMRESLVSNYFKYVNVTCEKPFK